MEQNLAEKVNQSLRRLEENDFAGFQAMCTDTATVWQNDGNGDQKLAERLAQLESFVADVDSLTYDVIRQFQNSHEVLQQHVLRLVMTDGSHTEFNTAVFFRFEGGLIDRIEEYVYIVPPENAS